MQSIASRLSTVIGSVVAAVAVVAAGGGTAVAAPPGEMTLTFVRHAESAGNASGLIDTSVPGPELTDKGWVQAEAVSGALGDCKFIDGVYVSTMVRTQQTAKPVSERCDRPAVVESGFHEIEAGIYEGTPERDAMRGYFVAPLQWMQGNLDARIPGSINGHEFKQRMDASIQGIQDRGTKRAVVFSHGGAMMVWAVMSLDNVDVSKLQTDPIQNTGRVVVKGKPGKGWKLVSWDGSPAA